VGWCAVVDVGWLMVVVVFIVVGLGLVVLLEWVGVVVVLSVFGCWVFIGELFVVVCVMYV